MDNWITGSSRVFDLSISIRSCRHFSSFLSFSRASTLGCVLLLPKLFVWPWFVAVPCPLPFGWFLGVPLPFSLPFFRLLNSFGLFPWAAQGSPRYFELSTSEFLRLPFELKPHLAPSPLLAQGMLLSQSFSHKMRRTVPATVQAGVSRALL